MARKLYLANTVPTVLAITILLAAGHLCAQDVLNANPDLWGMNAQAASADPTSGQTATVPFEPNHEVIVEAQLRGILTAARTAEKQGRHVNARRLYEQALQLAPTDRITLLSFARMLHRIGDFDDSIALYYRTLEYHRDDAVAMNDLALCYARKGELRHALAMMNGAVSMQPDSKRYRNNIAKLLLELGRPNDAFSHLVAAGGPAIGHYNMGQLLSQRGNIPEAVQYLEIAVGIDPSLRPAMDLLRELRDAEVVTPVVAPVTEVARLPAVDEQHEQSRNETNLARTTTELTAGSATPESAGVSGTPYSESRIATANSTSVKRLRPGGDGPWVPGSIRLQSASAADDEPLVDWAVGIDGSNEQNASAAPVPFDNQPPRYILPKTDTDAVGRFLDRIQDVTARDD